MSLMRIMWGVRQRRRRTLLLVDSKHDDDLIPAHTDELLDRSDTSPRELGEQNHSFDVVIFKLLGGG